MQHVKKSKISNPIPPFRKTSFLKFATLPRDRKWHISKSTTLPRAPYQPHAKNYDIDLHTHSLNGWKIHPVLLEILNHLTAKQAVDGCFFGAKYHMVLLMICWARWFTILNLQISHVSSRSWIDRFTGKKVLISLQDRKPWILCPTYFL